MLELALTTTAATLVLLGAVERLATVIRTPLARKVARLDLSGPEPLVWIDMESSTEDLNRVLGEILCAIASGPQAAPTSRAAPILHSVG